MTSTPDLVARLRTDAAFLAKSDRKVLHTLSDDFSEAADRLESLSTVERDRDEARRRRDEWRKKAEGFDEVRLALREKVGAPWPPNLSRALWAGIAADERKRANDAEAALTASQAEVARLTEALKQHERILLIAAVRRAAEIAAPLWLKAADDMSAALQQKEA